MRGLNDIRSWLSQDMVGTVETTAAPYWRLLKNIRPDARIVVVRRAVEDVVKSFASAGVIADEAQLTNDMRRLDKKLDQIEKRIPGVLSVSFDDLTDEAACARVFQFCLPYKHDHRWWSSIASANLQINLPSLFRWAAAHTKQLELLTSLCRHESKSIIWGARKQHDLDGMSFQEESFAAFLRDGQRLFSQHAFAVGEVSDSIFSKNLALLQRLDDLGGLQIVTARANGRMFGYLMTVLGPSLEDSALKVGVQTMFYASDDAKGLGMRLQRASVDALKARKGRWEIVQRAGVRASGPKLGAMYRRMGAERYGELYKITVGSA